MSKGLSGVSTPSAQELSKKWKMSLSDISKKIAAGSKVEREHTTSAKQAAEIARDHINERPDYYEKIKKMEKTPITKEEKLNELGEYESKGGTLGNEGLSDNRSYRKNDMAENDLKGSCWKGYTAKGLKKKGNRMVPNCVPSVKEDNKYPSTTERGIYQEDWQSVNRKDKTDGLSQKAVDAYRRENPGSKLQTAVTEKNPSGKRASRRRSFCSRMGGMKRRLTSSKTANDPNSRINKALRRWNCEESNHKHFHLNKPDTVKEPGAEGITYTRYEETIMDKTDIIMESLHNILEENFVDMKENLMHVLEEKAIEKLDERKKEIAATYFSE